jgi:Tfp pilus assembly protein PilF
LGRARRHPRSRTLALIAGLIVVPPAPGASPSSETTASSSLLTLDQFVLATQWHDALLARRVLTIKDRADARREIEAAQTLAPTEPRWMLARALVERADGNLEAARDWSERALAASEQAGLPDRDIGLYWCWRGTTIFEAIGASSSGLFDKADQASRGKAAYERALQLDNTLIDAHIGLAQYYIRAPGLMGGSLRKARERADALLNTPGGLSYAHLIFGQIAAYKRDRTEARRHFNLAIAACTDDHTRLVAVNTVAWAWLLELKDIQLARRYIEECLTLAPEVAQHWYMLGEVHRLEGDSAAAAKAYRRALELQPDARLSAERLKRIERREGRR